MTWVKLDDRYACHPKLIAAGPVALALDIAGMCYSAGYGTNGHVPEPVLAALLPTIPLADVRAAVVRLVDVCRWESVDGGWEIHDYLEYNPPASKVESTRKARQDAGHRGGKASGKARQARRSKTEANHEANCNPLPGDEPTEHAVSPGRSNAEAKSKQFASPGLEANAKQTRTPYPNPYPKPTVVEAVRSSTTGETTGDEKPFVSGSAADAEIVDAEIVDHSEHPHARRLCDLLADLIEANNGERPYTGRPGKRWLDAARLLLTKDGPDRNGYEPEQVEYLIRWSQADEFWRSNILSMSKLREKRLTLIARIQQERNGHGTGGRDRQVQRELQELLNAGGTPP